MTERFPVLIASSDPEHQRVFGSLLKKCGLEPLYATTVRATAQEFRRQRVALAFAEDAFADGTFRDVLDAARRAGRVPVVIASRLDDTAEYVEAMSLGAFDFIASPFCREEVERIVHHALPQTLAAAS